MALGASDTTTVPRLSSVSALLVFVAILAAYVMQTQLTEYVQSNLGYRQPFFLFYVTHAFFIFILPLHLLFLLITSTIPIADHMRALHNAVHVHHSVSAPHGKVSKSDHRPYLRFGALILSLTLGVSAPSILWYTAISLATMSSVTAIFNTNAFWTYLLSLAILRDPFRSARLGSVVLASVGVILEAYSGACTSPVSLPSDAIKQPGAPVLGTALAFMASASSSLFQVLYNKYGTISHDSPVISRETYAALPTEDTPSPHSEPIAHLTPNQEDALKSITPLPFALYANFMTTLIGLTHLAFLWIPFPILNYSGWEPFHVPQTFEVAACICGIAACGMTYNAGFMILLAVWGPIVTSVGSLFTTVLVVLVDVAGGACRPLWGWVGCTCIAVAFAVLASDIFAAS